jgi:serine/threonine-protein kinase SRPK3
LKENKFHKDWIETKETLDPDSPKDETYNVELIDYFEHIGPHGLHVVMQFDIYGVNLLEIIKKYG